MNAIRKPTAFDLTLLIGTMIVWGLAFVGMKIVVPETGPYWLAFGRAAFGLLIVLPIALWSGIKQPDSRKAWFQVILISTLTFIIPIVLISYATLTLDAGVAALLMGTGPFLSLIIAHFVTSDEHFTLPKFIAVLFGFIGIGLIVGVDAFKGFGPNHLLAQFALFGASASYITAGFTIRRVSLPPLSMTALSLSLATLLLFPISWALSGPLPLFKLSADTFYWMLFLGCIGSGFAFIARFHLIKTIGYSTFAIGINLIPVSGVILGALILNEAITLRSALALVLVVSGLFIARLGQKT